MNTTNYDVDFALLRQLSSMFGAPAQVNPGLFGVGMTPTNLSPQRANMLAARAGNGGNTAWLPNFGLPPPSVLPFNPMPIARTSGAAARRLAQMAYRPPIARGIPTGGVTGGLTPRDWVTGGLDPIEPGAPIAPKIPRFGVPPRYTADGRLIMGMY
jgi:hypothetical protein